MVISQFQDLVSIVEDENNSSDEELPLTEGKSSLNENNSSSNNKIQTGE